MWRWQGGLLQRCAVLLYRHLQRYGQTHWSALRPCCRNTRPPARRPTHLLHHKHARRQQHGQRLEHNVARLPPQLAAQRAAAAAAGLAAAGAAGAGVRVGRGGDRTELHD